MKHSSARLSFRSMLFALAVTAAAATGCSRDAREGALGNATFEYRSSRGCADLFEDGCPVSSGALLVGVNESLQVKVSSSDDPNRDLSLVSLAPEVVAVSSTTRPSEGSSSRTYSFRLRAAARGSAKLELRRVDGSVVDHVTVRTDEAAALDIVNEDAQQGTLSPDASRYTVRMGAQGSITGFARDARGARIHGNDAVVWEVEGREVAELSFGFTTGARVADDHVFVLPRAPGVTRATVRAGSVARTLEITVVP